MQNQKFSFLFDTFIFLRSAKFDTYIRMCVPMFAYKMYLQPDSAPRDSMSYQLSTSFTHFVCRISIICVVNAHCLLFSIWKRAQSIVRMEFHVIYFFTALKSIIGFLLLLVFDFVCFVRPLPAPCYRQILVCMLWLHYNYNFNWIANWPKPINTKQIETIKLTIQSNEEKNNRNEWTETHNSFYWMIITNARPIRNVFNRLKLMNGDQWKVIHVRARVHVHTFIKQTEKNADTHVVRKMCVFRFSWNRITHIHEIQCVCDASKYTLKKITATDCNKNG